MFDLFLREWAVCGNSGTAPFHYNLKRSVLQPGVLHLVGIFSTIREAPRRPAENPPLFRAKLVPSYDKTGFVKKILHKV